MAILKAYHRPSKKITDKFSIFLGSYPVPFNRQSRSLEEYEDVINDFVMEIKDNHPHVHVYLHLKSKMNVPEFEYLEN